MAKSKKAKAKADLLSTNHGSIISVQAQTVKGRRWLQRNVEGGAVGRVDCDHRYGIDILHGALDAGLRLQDSTTGRTAEGGV